MVARIVSSQIAASVKRAGVRFQSTAVDGGFTAQRDAVKKHAAGKKKKKKVRFEINIVCM